MRSECYVLLIPKIVRNFNIEDYTPYWIYLSSVVEIIKYYENSLESFSNNGQSV